MSKDKKILYLTSFITFAVLLVTLFVDLGSSKIVTACLLLPVTPIVCLLIRKRGILSINKREVLLLNTVIASLYVILLHMSGLYYGYYINPYFVNAKTVWTVVLPTVSIIITSEIVRRVFLAQKNRLVSVLTFLSCVIIEVLTYSSLVGIKNFNMFMNLVGMTLFPALCANFYYHYVSKNFGAFPNIAFRIITTCYIYFFPNVSAMSDALSSCIKIVFPIIMLAFTAALYTKGKRNAKEKKGSKMSAVATALTVVIIVSVAMLISCQFRFGALVIATESMTGEINKGDMIIYEQYDDQKIKEGQVIVFSQDQSKIIHRVIKIENIEGERRYYTKGDANETPDSGYRTEADIVGLTDVKIPYIGYPTLWLREIISN